MAAALNSSQTTGNSLIGIFEFYKILRSDLMFPETSNLTAYSSGARFPLLHPLFADLIPRVLDYFLLSSNGRQYYLCIILYLEIVSSVKLAMICFLSEQRDQWEESIQISTRRRMICTCTWKASNSISSKLTGSTCTGLMFRVLPD